MSNSRKNNLTQTQKGRMEKLKIFQKNTAGIRQYFKGKSAGNFQTNYKYQKSKDFQSASFPFFFHTKLNFLLKLI